MKYFLVAIVSFLLLIPTVFGQTVHPVDGSPNALYDAVLVASEGDILELTETGEYRIDSLINIDKKLTIRAEESLITRPILRNYYPYTSARYIFQIDTLGHLTLEGLDLDGMAGSPYPAENLIQTVQYNREGYSLYVDNCYLHDVDQDEKGSAFRAYLGSYADTIKFTNSVLYNIGKIGIRVNEGDNNYVDYFEFSNSSMFNVWNEGIYLQGDEVKHFRVDHCTFNNVGWGTADIIRPRFVLDAEITNSIFSNVPAPRTRAMLMYGPSKIDYCAFYEVGDIRIHDSQTFILGENILYDVDPQYFSVEYNDFSLLETSPMLTYAEDGGTIGDPNWPDNRPFVPVVLRVGSADNALYDSLQSARSGDIIELNETGEYLLDSLLFVNKEITIRAASGLGSKPILKNVNPNVSTRFLIEIETGGDLTLQGLDLDGGAGGATPSKYLIKTAESVTGTYSLKVDDCILHDVVSGSDGNFFRAYNDTKAENIIFTNSVLYNSGKEGIRIKDADNTVNYFEMSNSTMYNTVAEGIYVQGDEVILRIDYCTFNQLGTSGTLSIRPENILNADIRNSIFSNSSESQTTMEIFGASTIDYCNFFNVGDVVVNDESLFTMGENVLFDVDPEYADAPNGDFSLLEMSALYHISQNYYALGDPRWAVNTPVKIGAVIPVGLQRNGIYNALLTAKEGDILELTKSGEYLLDSLIDIDKSITIRAAVGLETKPVLMMINPDISTRHIFQIVTGGNLRLLGLDLDGIAGSETPVKYILRTDESIEGTYELIVEDCILHDVVIGGDGNFFRAYSDTYADSVIFRNCVLYNSGREGIRIKDSENSVNYFEMSNSTMYNTATEGIYVQGSNVVARIDHCTFNNCGIDRNEIVRFRLVLDADVRNSIFSFTTKSRAMLFYGHYLNYNNFYEVGSINIFDKDFTNLEYIAKVDPHYEDEANGNFTLLETSPLYAKASDGEALGDLRWATSTPLDTSLNIWENLDAPDLVENTTLTLEQGTSKTITSGYLKTIDRDNTATEIVYEITAVTANGSVRLSGINLSLGDTFTQEDVDLEKVLYQHDDSETVFDEFAFTVTDGSITLNATSFDIVITPSPEDTTVLTTTTNESKSIRNYALYPNPTSDHFFIDFGAVNAEKVHLVDMSGRYVRSYQYQLGRAYSIQDQGKGIYLILIQTSEELKSVGKISILDPFK